MRNKNARRKLSLGHETIAKLELGLVVGGASSDSGDGITRPGMASCWTCYLTHCCRA